MHIQLWNAGIMEYWKDGFWKIGINGNSTSDLKSIFQHSSVRIHGKNLRLHTEILTSNLRERGS
jgi:hypothetical protein